ncbi:Eco57I restriction-modification methylase domain-containing protein, partial [bacterium]|nr:Eco57I restriction-modification methylase domain-containing protein [bacterium]
SIYEGLLELQPRVAEEDLIETVDGGKPFFMPAAEVPNPRNLKGQPPRSVLKGEVYLVSSRGERKAMGSYYTPAFIVDYIVEHTVGPLAEEAAQKTAALADELRELEKRLQRTQSPESLRSLTAQRDDLRRRLTEPYLSLRLLDPAMGSGHFLVGAADFLSLAMATDPNLPEPEDLGDEEPQVYYKRLVVEQCLCGVDLNPLAVELAKLSLWLHTVSRDKALSFLDYHLRCGNSLIGAWVEKDLTREPPRFTDRGKRVNADNAQTVLGFTQALSRKHLQPMLDVLRQITQSPGTTAEAEHLKERRYEDLERTRDRFRQVANCWIAPFFGVPVTPEQYQEAVDTLQGDGGDWEALAKQEWFGAVQAKASDPGLRFFHWELEFPECFFGPSGLKAEKQRGFDAVIGNPPYGLLTDRSVASFARGRFAAALGVADIFGTMLERATALLAPAHRLGVIVPGGWLTSEQHEPLRRCMLEACPPQRIVVLPYDVFADAYVDTILYVGRQGDAGESGCLVRRYDVRDRISRVDTEGERCLAISNWRSASGCRISTQITDTVSDLLARLEAVGVALREVATIVRGVTPFNEVEGTHPHAVVGFHGSVNRFASPLTERRPTDYGPHLMEYRPIGVFRGERLLVRRIISRDFRMQCTAVTEELIVNKSSLIIHATGRMCFTYMLGILNSSLMSMRFMWVSEVARRDDYPQVDIATLGRFPIRLIDFDHATPPADKSRLLDSCTSALEAGDYDLPLALATQALATHALLHGPAGKPELREDPYWAEQIAGADPDFAGREDF